MSFDFDDTRCRTQRVFLFLYLLRRVLRTGVVALIFVGVCSCAVEGKKLQEKDVAMDVNQVIDRHGKSLLSIDGVVGVYAGVMDNDSTVTCIRVMVVQKTVALEELLPGTLGGFSVIIEETGEIKPME